jgi:hypothetical protein
MRLSERLCAELPSTLLFDHPSIRRIFECLGSYGKPPESMLVRDDARGGVASRALMGSSGAVLDP